MDRVSFQSTDLIEVRKKLLYGDLWSLRQNSSGSGQTVYSEMTAGHSQIIRPVTTS